VKKLALAALLLALLGLVAAAWLNASWPRALEAQSEPYKGLKVWVRVDKALVKVGEVLKVEVGVVNVGGGPVTIYHGCPLLFIAVYNATTGEKLRLHPSIMLPVLITTTIQPGEARTAVYELPFNSQSRYFLTGLACFSLSSSYREERLETGRLTVIVQ